jgi:trimeric autotransporter adhesin
MTHDLKKLRALSKLAGTGMCIAGLSHGVLAGGPCEPQWDLTKYEHTLVGAIETAAAFDGAVYVGGLFQTSQSRIARWQQGVWSDVGGGVNNHVHTLSVLDMGSGPALFVGGTFTQVGGWLPAERIARWDGQNWSSMGNLAGGLVTVRAIIAFDDGSGMALYAGGNFLTADGIAVNRVAKWNGLNWSALGTGLNSHVYALAYFNGTLYAGGTFTNRGDESLPISRLAKWDGQAWVEAHGGTGSNVLALWVFDDGSGPALYVGGQFTTAGPIAANRIAKWDGQAWSALGSGVDNQVVRMNEFDDGTGNALYVGGFFTHAGGQPAERVAKWDGNTWSALGGGFAGIGRGLAPFDDGTGRELVAAGSNRIASWRACEPAGCYANCDGSTTEPVLNVEDFTCFINEFAQAMQLPTAAQQISHYANCDGSTTEPVLNVEDFICFINAFAAGCP